MKLKIGMNFQELNCFACALQKPSGLSYGEEIICVGHSDRGKRLLYGTSIAVELLYRTEKSLGLVSTSECYGYSTLLQETMAHAAKSYIPLKSRFR